VTSSSPATVGELFPADDLVAQWVFSLSAVAEDLAITEAAFQDVLHGDGAPLWTGYHYRQVIARLYEAERPIISTRQRDDVRAFLAEIPDAAEHVDYLVAIAGFGKFSVTQRAAREGRNPATGETLQIAASRAAKFSAAAALKQQLNS